MGLFDAMLGNASKIDAAKIESEMQKLLASGERIEHVYRLFRDLVVFTDKRLLLIDKQGVSGSKAQFHSIPYRSITHFSIETAGMLDMDAELKLWISGASMPFTRTFSKGLSIYDVQAVLASYVLR